MAETHDDAHDHAGEAEKWLNRAQNWYAADEMANARTAVAIGHLHLALAAEHRRRPAPAVVREGVRIDYELTPKADQLLRERYPQ